MPQGRDSRTGRHAGSAAPPRNFALFVEDAARRHQDLSRRLQQISRFVVQNPDAVALDTVKELADKARVPPSSLVRFAQVMGYSGFSDMQEIFKSRMLAERPGISAKLGVLRRELGESGASANAVSPIERIALGDIAALEHLLDGLSLKEIARAVALMAKARRVWILGAARAYPIAFFLYNALIHLQRDAHLLDNAGGLAADHARLMGRHDAIMAVAFPPYPEDSVSIVRAAAEKAVPIIAMTDTPLNPIARAATVSFAVPEAEFAYLRSLAAPFSLAQMLAVSLAESLDPGSVAHAADGEAFGW